jgi:integrase
LEPGFLKSQNNSRREEVYWSGFLDNAGVRDLNRYGAHSLRAGFATTAFDNGVPEFKIRQQTGHRGADLE